MERIEKAAMTVVVVGTALLVASIGVGAVGLVILMLVNMARGTL